MHKNIAPVTDKAWDEINDTATEALTSYLSARKSIVVKGPYGKDFGVVSEGRLSSEQSEYNDVCYGNFEVKPLTEARIEFSLDRWELDNIERGDANIDLSALEEACSKIALFEENAIYNGVSNTSMNGLKNYTSNDVRDLGDSASDIARNISLAVTELKSSYAHPPFDLIVCPVTLAKIQSSIEGESLYQTIEKIIGGKIVLSKAIEGALLIPHADDDFQLIIGEDFTIGYVAHDIDKVRLYISESFTTRFFEEDKIIVFTNESGAEVNNK